MFEMLFQLIWCFSMCVDVVALIVSLDNGVKQLLLLQMRQVVGDLTWGLLSGIFWLLMRTHTHTHTHTHTRAHTEKQNFEAGLQLVGELMNQRHDRACSRGRLSTTVQHSLCYHADWLGLKLAAMLLPACEGGCAIGLVDAPVSGPTAENKGIFKGFPRPPLSAWVGIIMMSWPWGFSKGLFLTALPSSSKAIKGSWNREAEILRLVTARTEKKKKSQGLHFGNHNENHQHINKQTFKLFGCDSQWDDFWPLFVHPSVVIPRDSSGAFVCCQATAASVMHSHDKILQSN